MPSRWVGGRGSIASPVKDQLVEAKVLDDDGKDQGTILIRVKRLYSPGELGRMVLGDWISASDSYYRQWAESKAGRPSTIDGSYHFCKGDPATCEAGRKDGLVIHLGKWRSWKEDELLAGDQPEDYDGEARGLIARYFKRESGGSRPAAAGGLPWKGGTRELKVAPRAPALKVPVTKKARGAEAEEPDVTEKRKETPGKKGSQLKADLAELKRVTFRSPSRSTPRKTERKEKKKPTPPRIFGGGGLGGGGGDNGGSDPSDESSSSSSESDDEDEKSVGSVDWGDSPSGDDKKRKGKEKEEEKEKGSW